MGTGLTFYVTITSESREYDEEAVRKRFADVFGVDEGDVSLNFVPPETIEVTVLFPDPGEAEAAKAKLEGLKLWGPDDVLDLGVTIEVCADCAEIVAVVVAEAPGGPPPPAAPSPPPALPGLGFTAQGITAQEELGGGAIAGIVIAALVCCCLACAVTVYMCLRDRNAEERLEANKLYPPLPGAAPAVESQNAALCAAPPLEPAESAAPLGLGRVSAASAETDDAVGELRGRPKPNLEVRVSRNTSITSASEGERLSRMSATSVSQTPERGKRLWRI